MSVPLYQVDAFADRPFVGNPAAVCLVGADIDDEWMQAVATEMNLAETAFVAPQADGGFGLRWFTPAAEVDLCGHATLASAHVLLTTGRATSPVRFATRSGTLTVATVGDGYEMDFPATPPTADESPDEVLEAIVGAPCRWTGRSRFDRLALLENESAVHELVPDLFLLAELGDGLGVRGLIVTAAADPDRPYDFVSRFFAPALGVPEDPVTGSAHCTLAPFWSERLGRTALTGYQASSRGGTVGVRHTGDRVVLIGQAITVLEGTLFAASWNLKPQHAVHGHP